MEIVHVRKGGSMSFFFIGCFKIKNKFIKIVMVFVSYFPGKMSQKKDSRLVKTSASIFRSINMIRNQSSSDRLYTTTIDRLHVRKK